MTGIAPQLRSALAGISGILVTPFDASDQVAPERLKPIIARCAQAGVDALTVNGRPPPRPPAWSASLATEQA